MTNKKMTKRDYFNGLLGVIENHKDSIENYEDFKAFIEREIELLNKKRSNSKPTKTQIENEKIKENDNEKKRAGEKKNGKMNGGDKREK